MMMAAEVNPRTLRVEAYRAFVQADNAWSAELGRLFGKRAGDVRYTKRGEGTPGTTLNVAFLAFRSAGQCGGQP